MKRRSWLVAACGGAVVAGALLFATAPAPYLVNVPRITKSISEDPATVTTITPTLSPFYDVQDWQPASPGTLVRAEPIAGAPAGTQMYRILYHSQDLAGRDIPVTGLFVAPTTPAPAGGYPLIGYAHGTTGIGRACGMSQAPLQPNTPSYSHWVQQIEPMVAQGWAVVATDFAGMGAPGPASYIVGPLEARNVLDSMRAVIKANPATGDVAINADKLGVYGKSQGGEATLSTLEQAPSYAPDLVLDGGMALALGLVSPIPGALDAVASNPTSTSQNLFVMLIAQSYADNYPDLVKLDQVLTPEGEARLPLLQQYCGAQLTSKLTDVPLGDLLKLPVDSGLVAALDLGMPGRTPLGSPVVITQGLKDKTILPQFTHAQVQDRCLLNDTVLYHTYPEDDHPSIPYQSRASEPYIFEWMNDRFAGLPAPTNCPNQLIGLGNSNGSEAQQ